MAKAAPKPKELNIDLLPKEGATTDSEGLLHWILTIGRYLIIFTEIVALSTFIYGILLSKEKNDLKSSITDQANQVKALQTCDKNNPNAFCESRFRQIQDQLNQIGQIRGSQVQDHLALNEFLKLLPVGISLDNFTLEKSNLTFSGVLPSESELQTMITNFNTSNKITNLDIGNLTKSDKLKFSATAIVNLASVRAGAGGGNQ